MATAPKKTKKKQQQVKAIRVVVDIAIYNRLEEMAAEVGLKFNDYAKFVLGSHAVGKQITEKKEP